MTLTLVLAASDGFLALADGLRVKPTDDPKRPQVGAERLTAEDLATPSQHSAGLLVVGFELGEFTAFRVDVPARDFGDGCGMSSVRPALIDPLVPVLANPAESETGAMVLLDLDSYADFLDDDADDAIPARDAGYRFAGMSLAELRPAVIHRLGAWFSANSDMAASDGVGGLWSIAEVRKQGAVDVEHGLRPFD